METYKKLIATGLIALAGMGLAGCSGNGAEKNESASSNSAASNENKTDDKANESGDKMEGGEGGNASGGGSCTEVMQELGNIGSEFATAMQNVATDPKSAGDQIEKFGQDVKALGEKAQGDLKTGLTELGDVYSELGKGLASGDMSVMQNQQKVTDATKKITDYCTANPN